MTLLYAVFIIIHKAAVGKDFPFFGREVFKVKEDGDASAILCNNACFCLLLSAKDSLADSGDKHVIPCLIVKGSVLINCEGNYAPVDAVGAVALGGVLVANVGVSAKDLLAGSGLLTGTAVSGPVGKYAGTEGCVVGRCTCYHEGPPEIFAHYTGAAVTVIGLDALADANVFRDAAAQGKLAELKRIGAVT